MWEMREWRESGGERIATPAPENDAADAAEWVRARLGLAVDELQARVLRTTNKRGILNCSRQWGKSTVTAAKAVHQAYNEAESLTLVVSPSGAAERGVSAEGGGFRAEAGDPAEGRRG